MKIEKLRFLKREIEKEFYTDKTPFCIFYEKNNSWQSLDNTEEANSNEKNSIISSKSNDIAFHKPGELSAWFYISILKCSIRISFQSSPRIEKRKKIREKIQLIQERAENSFKVSHNSLTFLLARDAFYENLTESIKLINSKQHDDNDEQEITSRPILAVLALDIDYFKQVNDTYGHIYGDQVLKIFARRLESTASRITLKLFEKITITLGHPSGEEFLIFISGNCNIDEILQLANQFRLNISDEPLPSVDEWAFLSEKEDLSMINFPPQQERTIRTSIGVAIHSITALPNSSVDESKFLLDRADTALNKAKAGGRNQVVLFDKIMESYGLVLEHDKNTKVIAIDIGSNVGVVSGQEFTIYAPSFTGSRKFSINDGRTTRIIGNYPRVPLTRVTIFDVQPEIAFGFISNVDENNFDIDVGSSLEAIPIGSIGNIVPYGSKYFTSNINSPSINDINTLKNFINEQTELKSRPFSVVFKFIRDQEYLKKYGTAALNSALTHLYKKSLIDLHAINHIGVLDSSSLCLVGIHANYNETIIIKLIEQFCMDYPELGLVAGIFCHSDIEKEPKKFNSTLDPQYSIEFSQFAASHYGRLLDNKITHFNFQTAVRVLKTQRDAGAYSTGQTDFEKLKTFGVINPSILNSGGLIYSSLGLNEKAIENYELAMNLDSSNPIYKSNFALLTNRLGEPGKSLEILNSLSNEEVKSLAKSHSFGIFLYALLLSRSKIGGTYFMKNKQRCSMIIDAALVNKEHHGKYKKETESIRSFQRTMG
jgi:diguanylate cyclase (GGDEF)-like protein